MAYVTELEAHALFANLFPEKLKTCKEDQCIKELMKARAFSDLIGVQIEFDKNLKNACVVPGVLVHDRTLLPKEPFFWSVGATTEEFDLEKLFDFIQHCGKDIVIIRIVIHGYSDNNTAHENVVIVNHYLKQIEHYEPHGTPEGLPARTAASNVKRLFTGDWPPLTRWDQIVYEFNGYEFIAPHKMMPKIGGLSIGAQFIQGMSAKDWGTCAVWSTWYIYVRAQNYKEKDPAVVLAKALAKATNIASFSDIDFPEGSDPECIDAAVDGLLYGNACPQKCKSECTHAMEKLHAFSVVLDKFIMRFAAMIINLMDIMYEVVYYDPSRGNVLTNKQAHRYFKKGVEIRKGFVAVSDRVTILMVPPRIGIPGYSAPLKRGEIASNVIDNYFEGETLCMGHSRGGKPCVKLAEGNRMYCKTHAKAHRLPKKIWAKDFA